MRFLLFCVSIALFLTQCNPPTKIIERDSSINEIEKTNPMEETAYKGDYPIFKPSQNFEDFVKQHYANKEEPHYITIRGKVATGIHQHMMKSSLNDKEEHVYIDIVDSGGGQLVGYYTPNAIKIPKDNQPHLFLGILHSMTGAGKGGGMHTEWYVDLDAVE